MSSILPRLYFIAGENSGDFIGSRLIDAIKNSSERRDISFYGIGGYRMQKSGIESLFPISEINLMGFFEVVPHLFRINRLIDMTVSDILAKNVDIVVTIDSPGFTYRVAERIKKIVPHIKLVHVVAPSVWAYRSSRAKKYAKIYDRLLTLLPFEPKYFIQEGLSSDSIGHPVLEQEFFNELPYFREELKVDDKTKIIAVTPGSRKGEIRRHMPIIRSALDRLSSTHHLRVIFVQSNEDHIQEILKFLTDTKFSYSFSTDRLKVFAASDCALSKSGTNTLEIAASGTAQIVGYKLNAITFFLIRLMIKIKFASIINIVANREIIPEYIQSEFNPDNLVLALSDLLQDNGRRKSQVAESIKILQEIGLNSSEKPSQKGANIILNMLRQIK
jgi:lipid-A-disaccharide synthase